jgi:hypothetical protein
LSSEHIAEEEAREKDTSEEKEHPRKFTEKSLAEAFTHLTSSLKSWKTSFH